MSRKHVAPDRDVVAVMSRVASAMPSGTDGAHILRYVTQAAIDAVPGTESASISMSTAGRGSETLASTDDVARGADRILHELGTETGPGRTERLRALGVYSHLSVQILRAGSTCAVLNLYSTKPGGFDEASGIAELFASQAAIAMSFVRTTETLQAALTSRQTIGQAVGIVMERYHLDEEHSFAFLVRQSQESNVKLRVIARETVDGHRRLTDGVAHKGRFETIEENFAKDRHGE